MTDDKEEPKIEHVSHEELMRVAEEQRKKWRSLLDLLADE